MCTTRLRIESPNEKLLKSSKVAPVTNQQPQPYLHNLPVRPNHQTTQTASHSTIYHIYMDSVLDEIAKIVTIRHDVRVNVGSTAWVEIQHQEPGKKESKASEGLREEDRERDAN